MTNGFLNSCMGCPVKEDGISFEWNWEEGDGNVEYLSAKIKILQV